MTPLERLNENVRTYYIPDQEELTFNARPYTVGFVFLWLTSIILVFMRFVV